jgi:hypothetical protein
MISIIISFPSLRNTKEEFGKHFKKIVDQVKSAKKKSNISCSSRRFKCIRSSMGST